MPQIDCCISRTSLINCDKERSEDKSHHGKLLVLKAAEVDQDFVEPGILSGYRSPNYSYKLCLQSLFTLHNETVNIWTQLIPAFYFLHQLLSVPDKIDPFLFIYLFTTALFLFTSACAHTFSCLSPCARHVCFFFDYAGITLYACGCAVCYYAYALPKELMKPSEYVGADVCDIYLFLSVFFSITSTHLSCTTRFWSPSVWTKAIRLGAFVIIWAYLAIPVFWRAFNCNNWIPYNNTTECTSIYYWMLQFVSAIVAGLLYVSHFPERWFPGKFDIFGHSHQIFHIFGASGAFNQYRALKVDFQQRREVLRQLSHSPSLILSLLCITTVVFANFIIFSNFYKRLSRSYRPKHQ